MTRYRPRIKSEGRSVVTYETSSVEIFMDPTKRSGRLSNLYSISRGKGYATAILKMVCEWADTNDVYLWCVAKPYGNPRDALNLQQLVAFYEKFGFVQQKNKGKLELHRQPQGS